MALSVTCTGFQKISGVAYFKFDDGSTYEFTSIEAANQFVSEKLQKPDLKAILLAKYLHVDPTGANPNLIINHTVTVDLDAPANIVQVS